MKVLPPGGDMDMTSFKQLLMDWQRAVFAEFRLRTLGYAQSGYAERVGASFTTADALDDSWDPLVMAWHEFFHRVLPPPVKDPIFTAYLIGGDEKAKYGDMSSGDYYKRLKFARETALSMFNRAQNLSTESVHVDSA